MLQNEFPCDIILLAGQSNAAGNGRGEVAHPFLPNERILLMKDTHPVCYRQDEQGNNYLDVLYPTTFSVDVAEERLADGQPMGNLVFSFARHYVKNRLADGRKVLIVHAAVGGTGFARHEWGVGDCLFRRMTDMLQEALAYHPDNRLCAILWHQGEHDAYEQAELTPAEKTAFYERELGALKIEVRTRFHAEKVPFVCGGFCDEWRRENQTSCDAIYLAYRHLCEADPYMRFVETEGLTSNRQQTGNDDNIHFSRPALYRLGELYYLAYEELR